MSRLIRCKLIWAVLATALMLRPDAVFACAACYGNSDSPLAQGMNWGIFSLLAVVSCVLSGVAGVGFYFAKKAANTPPTPTSNT